MILWGIFDNDMDCLSFFGEWNKEIVIFLIVWLDFDLLDGVYIFLVFGGFVVLGVMLLDFIYLWFGKFCYVKNISGIGIDNISFRSILFVIVMYFIILRVIYIENGV